MAGLGFAYAVIVQPGDCVQVGGVDRRVLAVDRDGHCWPYFTLQGEDGPEGFEPGYRLSWQNCVVSAYWLDRLTARSIVQQGHEQAG